jgi:AcrR family transcriptional regulator
VSAGKRERNKQANRAAILEAAARVFLERGYDAVTIRDVVRETPLAAGTFYNYFRTKEDLLRALVEDHVRDLTAELRRVRGAARSLDEFVHGAYLAAFTRIAQDPVLYNLMLRNEAAVRALHQDAVMGLSTQALRDDIRDAIRRGIMPALDADYLAAAFFGAGYEMGRILAVAPKKDPAAAAAFATRLFLGGVQAFASDRQTTLKPRVRTAS